jgi:hypothetical protein
LIDEERGGWREEEREESTCRDESTIYHRPPLGPNKHPKK